LPGIFNAKSNIGDPDKTKILSLRKNSQFKEVYQMT